MTDKSEPPSAESEDAARDAVDPFRCYWLDPRDVRRSTSCKLKNEVSPAFSVFAAVVPPLLTPNGIVLPWEVQIGDRRFASLHLPSWLAFAPLMGHCSASYAVERIKDAAREDEVARRVSMIETPMRSAQFLDHIRSRVSRRVHVQWYDGDDVSGESSFDSGRELFDALIAPSTRNSAHLIEFIDGWYTPSNWTLD